MRQRWTIRIFGIALFFLIVIAGFGQAVHQLWNLLMPEIFGLPRIGFWQAVGLLGLSWILFGGWRGGWGGRRMWGGPRHMTPEQRRKFREGLRRGCEGAVPGDVGPGRDRRGGTHWKPLWGSGRAYVHRSRRRRAGIENPADAS